MVTTVTDGLLRIAVVSMLWLLIGCFGNCVIAMVKVWLPWLLTIVYDVCLLAALQILSELVYSQ